MPCSRSGGCLVWGACSGEGASGLWPSGLVLLVQSDLLVWWPSGSKWLSHLVAFWLKVVF